MKKPHLFARGKKSRIGKWTRFFWLCLFLISFASCVDGYKDDSTFSAGVTNTQLVSMDSTKIEVTLKANSSGETDFNITWPVVYGAGGYQFSLYIVDDPDHPQVVGQENQFIDGCSIKRPMQEDTKYKIVILALGNEKYNNKTALTPSEKLHSTLVPKVAEIPNGSDLAEYFATNPIQSSSLEQAYELVAGGNYTINSPLNFDLNWITLRGDKIDHAKITYGADGRMSTMAGLKLKFMDIDCSAVPSTATNASLLMLHSTPDGSLPKPGTGGYSSIENEVVIQSCNVSGINKYLLFDNNQKYCIKTFRIQDCLIALNSTSQTIYMQGGGIKDLILTKNTFYGLVPSSSYFVQYNSSARPTADRIGYLDASICYYNNTFYNVVSNGQMGNYAGMKHANTALKMTRNLFVNCGGKYVVRRISGGGTDMPRSLSYNCYWYDGGFASGEEMGQAQGDNSTANKTASTGFYEETSFTGPVNESNPANVNFTPTGSQIISERVGDPRWLPLPVIK